MSDIKIDIINPVRPYVLFIDGVDNSIEAYLDTSNIDKGIRFLGDTDEEIKEACTSLKGWIKPLWDKWLAGGNDNRDWLIDTPIDQLVAEGCPTEIRKVVDNLKALAIFYKYSSRKLNQRGYTEMYDYGRKRFTDAERDYIGKGEALDKLNRDGYYSDALFEVTTDDYRHLTEIEKHLYEIKPHHHHLLQLERDKVKHLITTESRYYGVDDWVGFVLDNPTKERLKEVQEWVDNLTAHSSMGYLMLFGTTNESYKHYKVMYMFNMFKHSTAPYRNGCKIIRGFLGSYSGTAYTYNGMDMFSNRKEFVDRLFSEVARENDYCLLKRGKSLDIRLTDNRIVSGAITDTSGRWPYLEPDLYLADRPGAQYYCYLKAYSGSFPDDEKRQSLVEITML